MNTTDFLLGMILIQVVINNIFPTSLSNKTENVINKILEELKKLNNKK